MKANPLLAKIPSATDVKVVAHDYEGDGPTVIFCHATGFHGRYWDHVCLAMKSIYRCISIDFRGHGDSEMPEGTSMRWSGMAEDLLAVVDHFNLDKIYGVGHSMGGSSILLAAKERPQIFEALWLFEPIVIPMGPFSEELSRGNDLASSARKRRERFASHEEAFQRYVSRPPFSTVDPEALRTYVDYGFAYHEDGSVILKCRGEIEAQVFENSATELFESLSSIDIVTTIVGSSDQDGPAMIAPHIAEELPKGSFKLLSGLTHFAPMEDPVRVAESVIDSFN